MKEVEKIKKILGECGLSPNGIAVYLASIQLGTASSTKIEEKAGLRHPSTHKNLGLLMKRHLLRKTAGRCTLVYAAENPQRLLDPLNKLSAKVKKLIPGLKAMRKLGMKEGQVRELADEYFAAISDIKKRKAIEKKWGKADAELKQLKKGARNSRGRINNQAPHIFQGRNSPR